MSDDPLYSQTLEQYPILRQTPFAFTRSGQGAGFLEYWPQGEVGAPNSRRPASLPLNSSGVEIRSDKTRPIDILGDIVSHQLVNTDPVIKDTYDRFKNSLTDSQKHRLMDQYSHAVRYEGEKRSYDTWAQISGLPGYFRGYAFKQWPDEFNEKAYTPDQRTMFDKMMEYLQKPAKIGGTSE